MSFRNSRRDLGYRGQEDYGVYGFTPVSTEELPEDYRSGGIDMDRFKEFCKERDEETKRKDSGGED